MPHKITTNNYRVVLIVVCLCIIMEVMEVCSLDSHATNETLKAINNNFAITVY